MKLKKNASKFMHTNVIDIVLAGGFRFTDYRKFHDQEPPIGDDMEGRIAIAANNYVYNAADGPNPLGPGIAFEGTGRSGVITGISFVYSAQPAHIFCVSAGAASDREEAMLQIPPDRYDAAIDIYDINQLARRIWASGRLKANDRRVKNVFAGVEVKPINYGKVRRNAGINAYSPPDYFTKDAGYRNQSEIRIALRHRDDEIYPEVVDIYCPAASCFLREYVRNAPKAVI